MKFLAEFKRQILIATRTKKALLGIVAQLEVVSMPCLPLKYLYQTIFHLTSQALSRAVARYGCYIKKKDNLLHLSLHVNVIK